MHAQIIEIVDREAARQDQVSVGESSRSDDVAVGFVIDLAHDLLKNILERDDPRRSTTLIHDESELFSIGLETTQCLRNRKAVRKIEDRPHRGSQSGVIREKIAKVNHTDHLIQIPGVNHRRS